jgi:YHS domain-containing protein
MKTRIMFLGMIAVVVLSILTAVYALTEEKEMKMGKPHHYGCPCMMADDPNCKQMCKDMGMSEEMMERCRMMMHARIDADCPQALLAMKTRLALTDEQVSQLRAIAEKSRTDSNSILTAGQRDILRKLAGTPDTMMKMHHEMMPMMKKMEMKEEAMEEKGKETMTAPAKAESAMEQKTCPVTGKPINKQYWTMYKGKKVYFCCPMCKPQFDKDPEKYIKNLPQFKE